jgi:hypothetical protein
MSLPPPPPPPPPGQAPDVRAVLGLTPRDAPADEPAAEPLKSVSPGPATNNPVFEDRVTQGANITDTMAGQNAGGFELRATQGQL